MRESTDTPVRPGTKCLDGLGTKAPSKTPRAPLFPVEPPPYIQVPGSGGSAVSKKPESSTLEIVKKRVIYQQLPTTDFIVENQQFTLLKSAPAKILAQFTRE